MTALFLAALLTAAAIVLDFASVRLDRQTDKLATDDAVMAGLRAADGGSDQVFNAREVCAALAFLKANRPALNGLPTALLSGGDCTSPTNQSCVPGDGTTAVSYYGATSSGNTSYEVWIKAPYNVDDASTGGPKFPEESLASVTPGNPALQGCDQLGIVIKQATRPTLGRLVTSNQLVTRVRSVGRVAIGPGDVAPALLLLDTTHCQVLALSAGGGGADSHIRVKGSKVYMAKRPDGTAGWVYTPGSIHADSKGTVCSGGNPNPPVMLGKATNGIVAYGAPDGSAAGLITSVAAFNGQPNSTVYDSSLNVYGTTAKDETSPAGSSSPPSGHSPVTRKLVDNRYLGSGTFPTSGVAGAMADAQANIFATVTSKTIAQNLGYKILDSCTPTAADVTAQSITSTSRVYVNCNSPGFKGNLSIPGTQIIFSGQINSAANVSMPDATAVYVFGSGNGIDASGGFSMHTSDPLATALSGNLIDSSTGNCTNAVNPSKATLFVKDGGISATGGLLRLCNTTVFLMGGRPNGCTSSISYTVAPNTTPCGGAAGTGLIKIAGTAIQDWTAPNTIGDMSALDETTKGTYWRDKTGPEDLALWSESYGNNSNWQMSGGGTMHLVGVFMTPNASPFTVKGGGSQVLSNAQYIASSFLLTGGATLEMTVDANNAISYPQLTPFSLVR